jgi:hypothetical protein
VDGCLYGNPNKIKGGETVKTYCAWHRKYFPGECDANGDFCLGSKEPLANPARTDGVCLRCVVLLEKELERHKIKKAADNFLADESGKDWRR